MSDVRTRLSVTPCSNDASEKVRAQAHQKHGLGDQSQLAADHHCTLSHRYCNSGTPIVDSTQDRIGDIEGPVCGIALVSITHA